MWNRPTAKQLAALPKMGHWKVRKCSEVDDIVKGCTWMMEVA